MKNAKRKPNGYWTKERCKKEIKKYKTIRQLRIKNQTVYNGIWRNYKELLNLLIRNERPEKLYTFKKCKEICLKYKTYEKFKLNNKGCYSAICKNNWYFLLKKLKYKKNPPGFWTVEKAYKESKKYTCRTDFLKNSRGAYNFLRKNELLNNSCSHMEVVGSLYKRSIYMLVFPNKTIYIGLSGNNKKRFKQHLTDKRKTVFKYIKKTGFKPKLKVLTKYLPMQEASIIEDNYIKEYERRGFNLLNNMKGGALGKSFEKWTIKKCKEEALKYKFVRDFRKHSPRAYDASQRLKCIKDFTFLVRLIKPATKWTKKEVLKLMKKYKTFQDFTNHYKPAYEWARRYGFLKELVKKAGLKRANNEFRPVYQCSLKGKIIKKWSWIQQAARGLGICNSQIGNCCRNAQNCKTAGGFIWKYAN